MNGVQIHYSSRCDSITQHGRTATAVVRSSDGATRSITADWIVAADGAGSRSRAAVGAELVGHGPLGQFFMVHFKADLSPWILDRPGPILWMMNPESSGTLIVHDITSSHVFMTAMIGDEGELETIPARLAAALGVDVDLEIITIDTWVPFCQVVDNYRKGRVLLVGDAAHRFPPSGGLGLNTGIMEAHNLAWKLVLVQRGAADDELLESFDTECRPAATTNANDSFDNALRLLTIYEALGPCATLIELERRLALMTDVERGQLASAIEDQRSHFLSPGALPAPEADRSSGRWPGPYDGFTLYAASSAPADIAEANAMAAELSRAFEVTVRALSMDAVPESRLGVVLTRPDGIVLWSSDQPLDHARHQPLAAAALTGLLRERETTQ